MSTWDCCGPRQQAGRKPSEPATDEKAQKRHDLVFVLQNVKIPLMLNASKEDLKKFWSDEDEDDDDDEERRVDDITEHVRRTVEELYKTMFPAEGEEPADADLLKGLDAFVESLPRVAVTFDAVDEDRRTALMVAAANGKDRAVKLLLRLGADTTLVDIDGKSAHDHAKDNNHTELAEIIPAPEPQPMCSIM